MHKFNRFFVGLLAMIMLFQTACGKKTENQPDDPQSTIEDIQDTQQDASESTQGESAETEYETTGESTERIIDNAENFDEQGVLKYIPNTRIEQGGQQELLFFQENLLLWGMDYRTNSGPGFSLAILSVENGDALQEASFSDFKQPDVQVCGDKISVIDWADGEILILDESLNVIREYQLETEYTTIYLSSDGTKAYCFENENGLTVVDLESGDKQLLIENTTDLYANSRCGDTVTVSYTDTITQMTTNQVLNLTDGTISGIPFSGAFYSVQSSDGIWMTGIYGSDTNEYYIGKSERPNSFEPYEGNAMMTLLNEPSRMMSKVFGANGLESMTIYDVDGRFLSEYAFTEKNVTLYSDPIWSEEDGGYFFLVESENRKDILLFWDMSVPVSGMDLQLEAKYEGPAVGTEVSQELYDRATAISETYGVTVKIAEQVDTSHEEYIIQQEMDEAYISAALDDLETVFSFYPDGFLKQLVFGNQYEIEVQLSGVLTRTDVTEESTGFTSYGGFATQEAGKNMIVLNIATPGSIKQLLYHELTHLIDYKMEFDAGVREDAVYSEAGWLALNPEDFAYADATIDLPMSFYTDGYDDWFIDLYSRTTIREDRARIMEHAMIGDVWAFGTSQRLAKLEYWCQCIRDSFDTTGWPEVTVWEETLEKSK